MKFLSPDWESRSGGVLNTYFDSVRAATNRVLFLDYDGTLAPFRVERDQAVPYPGVREILTRMLTEKGCRLIVVTGRRVADIVPLLGMKERPEIWGTHGLERLMPGVDQPALGPVPAGALQGLADAENWARGQGWTEHLETKTGALAIHWRGVPAAERESMLTRVTENWLPIF